MSPMRLNLDSDVGESWRLVDVTLVYRTCNDLTPCQYENIRQRSFDWPTLTDSLGSFPKLLPKKQSPCYVLASYRKL